MSLPTPTFPTDNLIFNVLKEAARDMMKDHVYDGTAEKVWVKVKDKAWYMHNSISVPTSRFPAVFFVIPGHNEEYHSLTRKKRWAVELQIEFYFNNYKEQDELYALNWIEELSRMIRIMPLHPYVNQPAPDVFKVLDWVYNNSRIEYFIDDSQLTLGVINSTTINLLDCRSIT